MDYQALATHALKFFERKTRPAREGREASRFWSLKDRYPIWIMDMIRTAHGDMLPDDYKYEYVVDTLDALSEGADPEEGGYDLEPDIYDHELITWLQSHGLRSDYVDDAVEMGGYPGSVMDALRLGQAGEKLETWNSVVASMRDRLEAIEEGIREDFETKGKPDRPGARGWKLRE